MEISVDNSKSVEIRENEKETESENGQECQDEHEQDVQEGQDDREQPDDSITTKFVDDSVEPPASDVYAKPDLRSTAQQCEEVLKPTFFKSSPLRVGQPKGNSRVNLSKGKRPRVVTELLDIDGDMLVDLETSKLTYEKQLFELSQTSHVIEKVNRTKNTLTLRIEEMHQKKILTLTDCVNLFMSENIPISMYLPISLSAEGLSDILKIDPSSAIMQTLQGSRVMQDVVRKTILGTKMLPVCSCGYIYVEPGLCFARHPIDPSLVIGKISASGKMSTMKHSDIITKLNAIRFFLELLYEYHSNK
jgi:hypothetical protein